MFSIFDFDCSFPNARAIFTASFFMAPVFFSHTFCIASLNPSVFLPSQRNPFFPCLIYSFVPRFSAAATGTAQAIASRAAIPNPSLLDGNRKRSTPCNRNGKSCRNPTKDTICSKPFLFTSFSSLVRYGPSPHITYFILGKFLSFFH